jgi:hypothetical protein
MKQKTITCLSEKQALVSPSILKLLFILFLSWNGRLFAQSTCCNNDTIYFENYIDCPICIKVDCLDPNSGSTIPTSVIIQNDSTGYNNSGLLFVSCPYNNCNYPFTSGYLICGGDSIPQTGQIIILNNDCLNCPALKFTISKIGNTIITPQISVNTSTTNSAILNNSPCCSVQQNPNLEMTFDCSSNTLILKCTQ